MGALTSKPYAFRARPWELETNYNFWFYDSICFNVKIDILNLKIERILPRTLSELYLDFIPDTVRFFLNNKKKFKKIIFPFCKYRYNKKELETINNKKEYYFKIIWPFFFYFKFNYLINNNILLKKLNIIDYLSNNLDILDIINLKKQKMNFGYYKTTTINLLNNFYKIYNFYFLNYLINNLSIKKVQTNNYNFYTFNFNTRLESPMLHLFIKKIQKKLKFTQHAFNNYLFTKSKHLNYELNDKGLYKIKKGLSIINLILNEKNKINILFINENNNFIHNTFKNKIVNVIYTLNNFYIFVKITKIIKTYKDIFNSLSSKNLTNLNAYNIYNLNTFNKYIIKHFVNNKEDIISKFMIIGIENKKLLYNLDFLLPISYFFERMFFSISIFNKPIFTKKMIENLVTNLDFFDYFYFFQKKNKKKLLEFKNQINKTFYNTGLNFFTSNKVNKQKTNKIFLVEKISYINNYTTICNSNYHKMIKNELQLYLQNQYA